MPVVRNSSAALGVCDSGSVKLYPFIACLVLLIASGVTACHQQAAPTDLNRIVSGGVVRVCSTGDYRPFTYRNPQGQWSGMDVDLAGNLATHLGVTLRLVPTTWSNLMDDLDTQCDLAMGGISITPDRAKKARYSAPYLRDGKAAAVRCVDSARYRSLADIDRPGVRVVVNPGGTNAEFDKANLKNATVVEYPDNNTIFGQITDGKVDAMITDASEIRWQRTQNPQLCGVGVDHTFNSAQKAYLIPSSGVVTQQRVNQWLNEIANDGTYAKFSQKWLGGVIGP
jgi:cyclohexadienyl dehydratase